MFACRSAQPDEPGAHTQATAPHGAGGFVGPATTSAVRRGGTRRDATTATRRLSSYRGSVSSRSAPTYRGLLPASSRASAAGRGTSRKRDTRCEVLLRRALWRLGSRFRVDVRSLPGRPDVVFTRQKVAVFVDGDFWHGRDLSARLAKLSRGHNAPYWVAKIAANVDRDERVNEALRAQGWLVVRLWESEVVGDPQTAAAAVRDVVTLRQKF